MHPSDAHLIRCLVPTYELPSAVRFFLALVRVPPLLLSASVHPLDDRLVRCLTSTYEPLSASVHLSDDRLVRCLASTHYALTSSAFRLRKVDRVFILSLLVHLGPSDTLVKHDALDMLIGYGVFAQLTRAQRMPPSGGGNRWLGKREIYIDFRPQPSKLNQNPQNQRSNSTTPGLYRGGPKQP
jgi:hypothetical protein